MRLPYPRFPGSKPSQWARTREAILSREVACPECGRSALFKTKDLHWKRPAAEQGSGENVICWCVETGCNEPLCELPVEFHILTDWHRRAEEIRLWMLRLFERGFFQKMKCGRGHPPGQSRIRGVRRIA